MLRPTPGDPWGVEQLHWNTGAKENQHLIPGGSSNRQNSPHHHIKTDDKIYHFGKLVLPLMAPQEVFRYRNTPLIAILGSHQ